MIMLCQLSLFRQDNIILGRELRTSRNMLDSTRQVYYIIGHGNVLPHILLAYYNIIVTL